jgi:nitronate monooxygenase
MNLVEGKKMFEAEVARLLEIKYPLIGGTMMWISYPEFVAAISNAGSSIDFF